MANRHLFRNDDTNARNHHGAPAYGLTHRAALAQYAVTGCLNHTYYASAQSQLADVLRLCRGVDSEFLGKTAVYARTRGYMKDLPALLCASRL